MVELATCACFFEQRAMSSEEEEDEEEEDGLPGLLLIMTFATDWTLLFD